MIRFAIRVLACILGCTAFAVLTPALKTEAAPKQKPEIHTDLSALPQRVKDMRARIIKAARSGDISALHPVVEMNELKPMISLSGDVDPIAYWKKTSQDGAGREIMAIMIEILEMPFARTDPGTSNETYVWPYLAVLPADRLTPAQQVDLHRLMTPSEAKTISDSGRYTHYRLGLGRDGTWHFFLTGD